MAVAGAPGGVDAWNAANADGNWRGKKPPLPAVPAPTESLSGIIHYLASSVTVTSSLFTLFITLTWLTALYFCSTTFLSSLRNFVFSTLDSSITIFCTNFTYQVNSNLIKNVFFFILILLINTTCIAGCINFELFCFFSHLSFYTCNNKNFLIKVQ